jgi:succinate dehydrogenase / fumarate reductase, flavoprotein subunit
MVSRAIITEIREGRGIKGSDGTYYVDLDLTHLPASVINEKLPEITGFARTYLGVEPTTEGVPVQPTAHYVMGGIPTDADGRVRSDNKDGIVRGFYAAGECACVSVHGANRLGTNSLLDIIVFGRRGGKAIASYLKSGAEYPKLATNAGEATKAKIATIKSRTSGNKPAPLRTELQQLMMDDCGIFRDAKGLESALAKIGELREKYKTIVIDDKGTQFNTDLLEAIELGNLLDTAGVVVTCALNRQETRGGHAREDFPERDDQNWMKHTFAFKNGEGKPRLDYRPVAVTKYQPKKRVY